MRRPATDVDVTDLVYRMEWPVLDVTCSRMARVWAAKRELRVALELAGLRLAPGTQVVWCHEGTPERPIFSAEVRVLRVSAEYAEPARLVA